MRISTEGDVSVLKQGLEKGLLVMMMQIPVPEGRPGRNMNPHCRERKQAPDGCPRSADHRIQVRFSRDLSPNFCGGHRLRVSGSGPRSRHPQLPHPGKTVPGVKCSVAWGKLHGLCVAERLRANLSLWFRKSHRPGDARRCGAQ